MKNGSRVEAELMIQVFRRKKLGKPPIENGQFKYFNIKKFHLADLGSRWPQDLPKFRSLNLPTT
jgi:hypothetical protein